MVNTLCIYHTRLKMYNWENFEKNCKNYLTTNFGMFAKFEHCGGTDSSTSDILVNVKDESSFYIEAKMSTAQCGQFVLLINLNEKKFQYSSKNKTSENKYSKMIVDFMNENFETFSNPGTKGVSIQMKKCIFYNWVINYYKEKKVKFFITKNNEEFLIFPIDQFHKYFDINAVYREKKSGSSRLNNSNKSDFENAMKSTNMKYDFVELDIISNEELNKMKISGNEYDYFLKKYDDTSNNKYEVRKLSNTKNANVIFSIKLLPYSIEQQAKDITLFKKEIMNKEFL